jgi:hypothetical protein
VGRRGIVFGLQIAALALLAGCNPKGSTPDSVGRLFTQDGLDNVKIALELYKREKGRYPGSLEQLIAEKRISRKSIVIDAWGNTYVYARADDAYTLFSAGPDGQPHTADDVLPNW